MRHSWKKVFSVFIDLLDQTKGYLASPKYTNSLLQLYCRSSSISTAKMNEINICEYILYYFLLFLKNPVLLQFNVSTDRHLLLWSWIVLSQKTKIKLASCAYFVLYIFCSTQVQVCETRFDNSACILSTYYFEVHVCIFNNIFWTKRWL